MAGYGIPTCGQVAMRATNHVLGFGLRGSARGDHVSLRVPQDESGPKSSAWIPGFPYVTCTARCHHPDRQVPDSWTLPEMIEILRPSTRKPWPSP